MTPRYSVPSAGLDQGRIQIPAQLDRNILRAHLGQQIDEVPSVESDLQRRSLVAHVKLGLGVPRSGLSASIESLPFSSDRRMPQVLSDAMIDTRRSASRNSSRATTSFLSLSLGIT